MAINSVKGTHDIIGKEAMGYQYIENVFKAVCELYGYRPLVTPILEHTEVFTRATGEASDVVRKEMYTFLDKGGRSLTLRPEGTAGAIRCLVEHKLAATNDLPLKYYYFGPVFRYERPQLGRYRQFIQAGIEAVGEDSPYLDAEAIVIAMRTLDFLGFQNLKVKVNSLGDQASRDAYRDALRDYFRPHLDSMCADCQERFKLNPLRMLDCKVPSDIELGKNAPKISDYLSDEAEKRFYKTLSLLNALGVEYEVDPGLVRGLDYYGQVVFEVHATSSSGADYGALLGGGHYDGMLSDFGGDKSIDHGVGFAMGVERLYSILQEDGKLEGVDPGLDIYLMPLGEDVLPDCFELAEQIRGLGYTVSLPYEKLKMGAMFKRAERANAKFAIIVGSDEIAMGEVQLKNLATKEQISAKIETLQETLDSLFGETEEGHHHE